MGGANPLVASVSRLVPCSGIQFIDLVLNAAPLSATVAKFIEEQDPDDGPLLIPLSERADCDGIEWHPLTGERLEPSQSLWISGYQALEPFLGSWIPLPYLRFLGRDEDGEPRYDKGPSNWVRLYIERPPEGLRNAETLKAVLAIDTQIDAQSRIEQRDYLFPNVDDVIFAPIFKLASDAGHVDDLLGSVWFDAWLKRLYARFETADARHEVPPPPPASRQPSGFKLEPMARYLSMLKVLDTALEMPQFQFVDVRSAHWRTRSSGVDLLIDIDTAQTAAAIVPSRDESRGTTELGPEELKFRDLSSPTNLHEGPFPTIAEFSAPDFGDEHASLRSGRLDAFYWPSLVRVGTEGLRLSHAPGAAPGETGLSSLIDAAAQTTPHEGVWRFSRSGNANADMPGAMVSGRLLAHLSEDGTVITDEETDLAPALRPHFSSSAILSMFVAECVLHAMAQINDPHRVASSSHLRTLKRVLVTCPLSASDDERKDLKARVEQALKLIWQALGWNGDSAFTPQRPEVALSIDAGLSSQIVYLQDEIQNRFSGGLRQFVSLVARTDAERRNGRPAGLRVATLDLASRATTLCVVNYALGRDGGLTPGIEVADRTTIAGDGLVDAVAAAHVLPAIATALNAAGHPDGAALMRRIENAQGMDQEILGRHFSAGFMRKLLIPAASALIDLHQAVSGRGPSFAVRRVSLGHVVRLGNGRMSPLDDKLEVLAAAEGARQFRLADVAVWLDANALSETISRYFEDPLSRASEACRTLRADLVLLSGRYADLDEVKGLLEMSLPFSPHRIVNMNARFDDTAAEAAHDPRACVTMEPRLSALIAAAQCGRGAGGQFDGITAVAEELQLASPPQQTIAWLSGEETSRPSSRYVSNDASRLQRSLSHDRAANVVVRPSEGGV